MIIQKSHGKTIPTEQQTRTEFKMIAKTMFGLEEILADELQACGAKDIEPLTRAVAFTGDMRVLYRANSPVVRRLQFSSLLPSLKPTTIRNYMITYIKSSGKKLLMSTVHL